MNILTLAGLAIAGFLGWEWIKNQNVAASATINTSTNGGTVGSSPTQFLTDYVQKRMLANAIKQGPAENLTQYNAFGELLAPAWAWNNWMDQIIGMQTDYSSYFSVPTQPISLSTFVNTVMSGANNLSGIYPRVSVGPNFAGAKEIFNAMIQ